MDKFLHVTRSIWRWIKLKFVSFWYFITGRDNPAAGDVFGQEGWLFGRFERWSRL